jgi:chromate transporter
MGNILSEDERSSSNTRLIEVALLFLRLGFTAFGGPAAHIAMMRQEVVQRRKWISDERFMDLLGVINLIPGPNSTQLAIYLGYMRVGWPGLIVGGICFIGPAMLMVMTLAWLYVRYGALPAVDGLLYGIKAVVIAIIAFALWGLARGVLKDRVLVATALVALVLYLLGINGLLLIVAGGICVGLLRWGKHGHKQKRLKHTQLSVAFPVLPMAFLPRRLMAGLFANEVLMVAVPVSVGTLFLAFLKIGATLYGGGYVILAFLRSDFVEGLHWLTEQQVLTAVSIGQFTPGPVFTTATFVGFLVMGWWGALVATVGIFLPSFVFIALIHPLAGRLRKSPWTAPVLDGVNAAALALMAGVLLQLGQDALLSAKDWITNGIAGTIAALSFGALWRFKVNSAWLILAGGAIGLLKIWLWGF